ncbi:sensor histidine kinase [Cohnella sp.]|uniref:cache domain-containing sensor histidine kinase n=1 Tax=Cohnella sp. TaxID=1883426 RepID=UPI003565B2EA
MINPLMQLTEKIVNMRISTKMIMGYLILVMLPFLIFAFFIYYQLYDKMLTQYQLANQQNIEQVTGNMDSSLAKIESLYSIFQNNSALIDYLQGEYTDDRELIYSYLKEISPAISYAYLGEPFVSKITIYPKYQKRLLTVPGFRGYNEIDQSLKPNEIASLRPVKGLWTKTYTSDMPSVAYFHNIYNDSYKSDLGIIQFAVNPSLLNEYLLKLRNQHPGNALLLIDQDGNVIYELMSDAFTHSQISDILSAVRDKRDKAFLTDRNQLLINSASLSRLGLTVVEVNKIDALFKFLPSQQLWAAGGIALLLLLSALYYLIVTSLTKRIILLSRHMRRVGLDSLSNHFTGKIGKDEIGFLINNYNAMISRMDELVNRVQKVELLKKEAEFKMLQAQIQPHFLYNTLETMRMLARGNNDPTVAEMAFSLGNILRYSLSKGKDTTLQDELENVRAYIAIHQIRMRDLHFDLDVEEVVLSVKCPRFILQPLVENSMIHGLSKRRGKKKIKIRLLREKDYARIEVSDNGMGMDLEKLSMLQHILNGKMIDTAFETEGTGIGLSNVSERIKAFFGMESGITITSTAGEGTICTLILALKEDGHAKIDDC